MSEKLIGIIGTGKMGLLHGAILNKIDGCRLAALCDTNELLLKIMKSGNSRIETYTDYQEMIEQSSLDVIAITTPVFLHEKMAETAMKAGINVIIEKPLAKTVEECSTLVKLSNNAKSLVGYCRRFMPTFQTARKMVQEESFGKVVSFQSHMLLSQVVEGSTGWQYDPNRSGGGVLMDLGCHAIDMVHYILGPIDRVRCKVGRVVSKMVEDEATLMIYLQSGTMGNMRLSWCESGYRLPELRFTIQCDEGQISVTEKYIETITKNGNKKRTYKQELYSPIPFNIGGREYTAEDVHLIECIDAGMDTGCNVIIGSRPNSVIEAAYASANSNAESKVSYLGE